MSKHSLKPLNSADCSVVMKTQCVAKDSAVKIINKENAS